MALNQAQISRVLLLALAALLVVMPFIATFDDLLTAIALKVGFAPIVQQMVPFQVRMLVWLLNIANIPAASFGSYVIIDKQAIYVSWNCIGWQSLFLLVGSLITGLRGNMKWETRAQIILIGMMGTFFVNLLRMAMVIILAVSWGYGPAILFHDYAGTLISVAWLLGMWWFVAEYFLPQKSLEVTV